MATGRDGETEIARIRALIDDWSEALRQKDASRVIGSYRAEVQLTP